MTCLFVKRDKFSNKEGTKEYYTITSLLGHCLAHSFVDKDTYQWFDNFDCGEEIPSDFTNIDLYEGDKGLSARVSISVNNKK